MNGYVGAVFGIWLFLTYPLNIGRFRYGPTDAAIVISFAIIVLAIVFHGRLAPLILIVGVAFGIWLFLSFRFGIGVFLYEVINVYAAIGIAVVCTTAGVAGVLLHRVCRSLDKELGI